MKLKKIILGLAVFAFMAVQLGCFAADVTDSAIKVMVNKYKAHNFLGCIQDSDKIIETNPSNIYAHYYKGLSYYQLGKHEQATESFSKVEMLNTNERLVKYAQRAKACIETPDECKSYSEEGTELDKFIKSNRFYDKSVQSEVNKKKLDRIKENINEELNPKKSEMPSNEEIANAVKTLAKVGFNPMNGMNPSMYQNPEMMQMSMLLGSNDTQGNNGMNNMLPYFMMGQNGANKMSPELIQTMMMNQMTPTY